MTDLIVKSKIKEAADGLNVASDFHEALNRETNHLVKKAVERAKANNRRTLQARDL